MNHETRQVLTKLNWAVILLIGASSCVRPNSIREEAQPDQNPILHGEPVVRVAEPDQWGERVGDWRLAIAADKTTFDVGEMIPVTIIRKNVSDRSVEAYLDWLYPDFQFIVRDDQDSATEEYPWQDRQRTRYYQYRRLRGTYTPGGGSFDLGGEQITVGPGESITQVARVNAFWDMTLPATYTIVIKARARDPSYRNQINRDEVHNLSSNQLTVIVKDFGSSAWEMRRDATLRRKDSSR